jgi:hypothetical protein
MTTGLSTMTLLNATILAIDRYWMCYAGTYPMERQLAKERQSHKFEAVLKERLQELEEKAGETKCYEMKKSKE